MLFGSEGFKKDVLEKVFHFAKENKFEVIYGAVVGGISKGLQYYDSDYDTRFLYVNEDFPKKIYIPSECKEKDIVKRFYSEEDETTYEWIPCWELTSFLQYLVVPSINHSFSTGLYNIVGWTLGSPYAWDPYGLQNKLMPLINSIFVRDYILEYHLGMLEDYFNPVEVMVMKDYLYAIYAAMTLQWAMDYNSVTPVYAATLLANVKDERVRKAVIDLIQESKDAALKYMKEQKGHILHSAHYNTFTRHQACIDDYIIGIRERTKEVLKSSKPISKTTLRENSELVHYMYDIIYQSMHEQKVRFVNE